MLCFVMVNSAVQSTVNEFQTLQEQQTLYICIWQNRSTLAQMVP